MPGAPHLARVSRDVGYHSPTLRNAGRLQELAVNIVVSHISRNTSEIPGFPARCSNGAACAAFIKESRMKFIVSTKLHRKSGVWGTRLCCSAQDSKPVDDFTELGRIWVVGLILHLHHRNRPEAFQEGTRFHHFKLRIVGLQAKKEFVRSGPVTEIRSVEERVIERRKATHG
jgi:hypothetical protein